LFVIDEWGSDSGFVEKAWRTHSVPEPLFMSIAASHWQIVVTTQRDLTQVTVRGPETKATVTAIPTEAEFFGIVFSLGLTRRTIRQIARAENAVEALGRGLSSPDAALQLGYADQAHLIRSLKRFIGQTPAQVVNHGGHWSAGSPVEPRSSRDG